MVTNESIKEILSHYDCVSRLLEIKAAKNGSGNSFIITTSKIKYFLKFGSRQEDVDINQMFHINSFPFKYPNIYLNNDQQFITKGAILYEHLEGMCLSSFDKAMTHKAIRFLYQYNQELAKLKSGLTLSFENHWDNLRDENYLLYKAASRIKSLKIPERIKNFIDQSLDILRTQLQNISNKKYQLIHLDPGPDNFLLIKNKISTLIDFSLAYNHELLSLAHFLYWNYLQVKNNYDQKIIDEYLAVYYEGHFSWVEYQIFLCKILEASLYRVLGPLFEMESQDSVTVNSLSKRLDILHFALDLVLQRKDHH